MNFDRYVHGHGAFRSGPTARDKLRSGSGFKPLAEDVRKLGKAMAPDEGVGAVITPPAFEEDPVDAALADRPLDLGKHRRAEPRRAPAGLHRNVLEHREPPPRRLLPGQNRDRRDRPVPAARDQKIALVPQFGEVARKKRGEIVGPALAVPAQSGLDFAVADIGGVGSDDAGGEGCGVGGGCRRLVPGD